MKNLVLPWLAAVLGLTAAIAGGVLAAELLMGPPQDELVKLATYFGLAGGGTLAAAWLALRAFDRTMTLSIQAKAFVTGLLTAGIALLNVLIIAELMFVSTEHDLKLLIAAILFSALVAGTLSLGLAREVSRRLEGIARVVESLADGDYAVHTSVSGRDEVAELAADVNDLAERLREAEERREALDRERRELTAAISHDLRTPLASLRAMVEALEDGVVQGPEIARYHVTMRREIDRLSRMIDDLFLLAQMDAGALRLKKESLSVEEILADVVDALQPQARQYDVNIELRTGGPAQALVDGGRIERAVANLVRNAIEHTPTGGRVEVTLETVNGWVDLRVSDSGEGIDEADLPYIWQRFYRAERSRQRGPRNADGAGLGLAIVRGIVDAHGGTVSVECAAHGGSTFGIRLPRE